MTLTKAQIVEKIQVENGLNKKQSVQAVEFLLETIKQTLGAGEDVLISGFGKFCVKDKEERWGRNPVTGENIMLKSRRVVTFKCSGKMRSRIDR